MFARPISPSPRMIARALGLAAVLPLAACAAQGEGAGGASGSRAAAAPPGQVVGEPVNCIQTSRIRSTTAHTDETIDFEMAGGPTYRNTLPNRCHSLGFENRFTYSTSTGQLCSTDIIYILYSDGRRGAGCGLGQFLPIELAKQPGS